MWVRFTANHDFSPAAMGGRVTLAYKARTVANVTRECADDAVAKGRAVKTTAPRRETPDAVQVGRG